MTKDTEYTLTSGPHTVVVSPFGASLRSYVMKTQTTDWNVIWGYAGGANKKGGQGDVLIPFPGRIKNGTYKFEGVTHELEKNDKDGPNAIHGFLRSTLFNVETATPQRAIFTTTIANSTKGFPFTLSVEVKYELNDRGLETSYKIKNVGKTIAPAGVGFHPYFRCEIGSLANWSVKIPAADFVELEKYVPTGRIMSVEGNKRDFRRGRIVGAESYNDCLLHLTRSSDGYAYAEMRAEGSKNRIVIGIDRTFDYVVIYTGDNIPAPDARQGFAIEPMTCAPDAFNFENWGAQVLKPGSEMSGSYFIRAEINK